MFSFWLKTDYLVTRLWLVLNFRLKNHSIAKSTRKGVWGGEGVSRKSTLGHMTKGSYHEKCPLLSTGGGQNWIESRSKLDRIWST